MTIRRKYSLAAGAAAGLERLMQPEENLDLGHGLHMRVLVRDDAALLDSWHDCLIWAHVSPGK